MLGTGIGFATVTDFLPLLLIAVIGTLNPSNGDVSVFAPLEHSLLSNAVTSEQRTTLFARYSLVGNLVGAVGALSAAIPGLLAQWHVVEIKTAVQVMFVIYGFRAWRRSPCIAASIRPGRTATKRAPRRSALPSGSSDRLAALFRSTRLAGALGAIPARAVAVPALRPVGGGCRHDFLLDRHPRRGFVPRGAGNCPAHRSRQHDGVHAPALQYLLHPRAVHADAAACSPAFIPAGTALAMDVPARSSYVMAVVSPAERAAAAGITAVPRSLVAAISPAIAGYLLR